MIRTVKNMSCRSFFLQKLMDFWKPKKGLQLFITVLLERSWIWKRHGERRVFHPPFLYINHKAFYQVTSSTLDICWKAPPVALDLLQGSDNSKTRRWYSRRTCSCTCSKKKRVWSVAKTSNLQPFLSSWSWTQIAQIQINSKNIQVLWNWKMLFMDIHKG